MRFCCRWKTFLLALLVISLMSWIFLYQAPPALAISNASIRLSSQTSNTSPLPVLITLVSEEAVAEDELRVTVPSGWTISVTASDYSVSTTFLPADTLAMPGIGTATSVNSQTITFPISDLTPGLKYGFFVTGGVTSTPATVPSSEQVWQLALWAGASLSESSNVAVDVVSNDQISITAQVGPTSQDLHVELTPSTTSQLPQDTEVSYSLTYSTDYVNTSPITLESSWELGKVGLDGVPIIEIVEYVSGSASHGYGSTDPVIDVVNRKIIWEIPAFSQAAGTQEVTFKLKTLPNYTGSQTVYFNVSAAITDPVVSLPSTVTHQYSYQPPPTPTPSPTATPTPTSTATPSTSTSTTTTTPTPTPTPTSVATAPTTPTTSTAAPVLQSLTIQQISATAATFTVLYSQPVQVVTKYGLSPQQLNSEVTTAGLSAAHSISLSDLTTNTPYYFQLIATNENGISSTSDIYLVTTAQEAVEGFDQIGLQFTHQGLPIAVSQTVTGQMPKLTAMVVPQRLPYELIVTVPSNIALSQVKLIITAQTNHDARTNQAISSTTQLPITPIGDHKYLVRLNNFEQLGWYSLNLDLEDVTGNKRVWEFAQLKVVNPLIILDSNTKHPVENSTIVVERWNPTSQLYQTIDPHAFGLTSQFKSGVDGVVPLVLPFGQYRVTVSSPNYQTVVQEFALSETGLQDYPEILMAKKKFSIFSIGELAQYYQVSLQRLLDQTSPVLTTLKNSRSIYHLVSFASLSFLSLLLFLSLRARTHLSVSQLPSYVKNRFRTLFGGKSEVRQLHGKVINDQSNQPIAQAKVSLVGDQGSVLSYQNTMANGYFHFSFQDTVTSINIAADGYQSKVFAVPEGLSRKAYLFELEPIGETNAANNLKLSIEFLLGTSFEILLLLLLAGQWLFISSFEWWEVTPFILIGAVNLLVWTFYTATHLLHPLAKPKAVPLSDA